MLKVNWRKFDFWLFGSVVLLSIFGIMMIQSAIAGSIELQDYDQRQVVFALLGMAVILVFAAINYQYWAALTRLMYIFIVGFLVVIYVYGVARFGSARWVDTGLFTIQPSELAKIIIILVLANYFASSWDQPRDLHWLGLSLALTGGVVIWIVLQPNLSTSIVILVLWFSFLWVSGLPPKFVLIFGIVGAILGVAFFLSPFMEGYQKLRIVQFLFPDRQARHGNTYNVDQALISIGSGGLFGQGYGYGTQVQLRYLKVRHTDFIFSAIAEEFGFVGTTLVVLLLVFMIVRCFIIAQQAADRFGGLIAYGFGVLMAFQTIVNIGVNLNVLPVTGLTLPFVSYGGSSMISLALGIGLVESVALRRST